MKTFLLALSFLMACTSKQDAPLKKYVLMDSLWKKDATKEEVIQLLGSEYNEAHGGVIYTFPDSKSIESGHFFDKSQALVEQFIFLDEKSLADLKIVTSCSWNESEKNESVGHTVYSVRRGKCTEKNISYEFKPGSNHYEVRWKR